METTLIIGIALGLLVYWLVKAQGEVMSPSSVTTVRQFLVMNTINILLSLIGAALLVINGTELPLGMGTLTGVVPAFIAGGSIPSMINNISALFKK
jgi:hypothetical protein